MLFSRAPVPGETKTRLIPALGAVGAATLHSCLVERILNLIEPITEARTTLWCTPDCTHPFFHTCKDRYSIQLRKQKGVDLGERMQHAFHTTLHQAPWAIALGTDCAALTTTDIRQAINLLEHGMDAVAGPAFDGGYYLLGLRRFSPRLFDRIPWGTDQVWKLTRQRLEALGWSYATVARHHDLDRPEDLIHLARQLHPCLQTS